ncbi:hypothetical protein [Streptomyces sp. NPDC059949]|uniref:hypothetical protein n=1 Tax=Streptomyces sp. NPDC059949 TaxID=3347013 RepID=UPI00364B3E73
MPDGIDGIDWAALEDAYGPADDVPDLLRAAGSATAAAVPFVAPARAGRSR